MPLAEVVDLSGLSLVGLREGDLTTVNTETELTTWGSDTAPGALNLDGPVKAIISTVATDGAAAGSSGFIARIRGAGASQQYDFPVGSQGGTNATGGFVHGFFVCYYVDITLTGRVRLFGEMVKTDSGTARMTIALYG